MQIHSRFSLPMAALLVMAPVCQAIAITRTFITAGNAIGTTGVTATAAAPNVAGGGNLLSIFNTAAGYWEAALLDSYSIGLSFGWGNAGGGSTLAFHSLGTQGGSPNREISGGIVFDSSASFAWFLDASPADNSEYGPLQTASADLGGGTVNDARFSTPGQPDPLPGGSIYCPSPSTKSAIRWVYREPTPRTRLKPALTTTSTSRVHGLLRARRFRSTIPAPVSMPTSAPPRSRTP